MNSICATSYVTLANLGVWDLDNTRRVSAASRRLVLSSPDIRLIGLSAGMSAERSYRYRVDLCGPHLHHNKKLGCCCDSRSYCVQGIGTDRCLVLA